MRITGGEFRRRNLITPKDNRIRPTSDKARLAIFNMLESRGILSDAIVIDAFCGTGALGIEALSRGAEFCIFIDNNRDSIDLCRQNIEQFSGIKDRSVLVKGDACNPPSLPVNTPKADLLFLDPPYGKGLIALAIQGLRAAGLVEDLATAVMETGKGEPVPELKGEIIADKEYGNSRIIITELSET